MTAAVARIAAVLTAATLVVACSSDDGSGDDGGGSEVSVPAGETVDGVADEPTGLSATFTELTGGAGPFVGTSGPGPDLDAAGYTEVEYAAAGTATSYTSAEPLPADGTFELEPGTEAEFRTRALVRRPATDDDFNGSVVVEWLNVSGGVDAAPDYTYLADELVREGYAWVGVSAQLIGVEGGPVAVSLPDAPPEVGAGLKAIDPERYGDLEHPGDAFAYDIYTQVGRGLISPDGGEAPLDGLEIQQVLGIGESQSAFALTTYINGVQPLARVFDGFLVHSRGGAAFPLGEPGVGIGIADAIGGEATTIRTDGGAPVIVVQTEGDVLGALGYLPARQPDSSVFRLWEVAGAAHADLFQIGDREETLGCATPINRGQQVFVLRAALRHLAGWAGGGEPPPEAERLEVDETGTFVLDDVGNVQGGVRTPVVDAPVDVLSGLAPEGSSVICLLLGSTLPVPDARLSSLFASDDEYLAAYEGAADAAIAAGFVLADDREPVLDGAQPDRIP
jgi:hypothetical protein